MKPQAAVIVLWLVHVAAGAWWLAADTRPPTYDAAGHALVTLRLADHVAAGELRSAARLLLTRDYPPLLYVASAPLAWAFGRSADVLTAVNVVFLAILLGATYAMAREVSSPAAGLLAAAVVSAYPYVYGLSRQLLIDFPLTALVALALWLTLRASRTESLRASLALGVALGLGLLAKTTFVQFAAAPTLILAAAVIARRRPHLVRHGLAVVLPPLLLAGFWYWRNLAAQWRFIRFQTVAGAREGDPAVSWLHYLDAMGEVQMLLPFVLAFLFALGATLASRRYRTDVRVWMVLAAAGVPYVLLSLQPNKDPRYSMPCLPAVAVITAWGLSEVRWRSARVAVLLCLGTWAVVQLAGLTFGLGAGIRAVRLGPLTMVAYTEQAHTITPARREDWRSAEIVRALRDRPGTKTLLVLPDAPFFEPNVFAYQLRAERIDGIEVERVTGAAGLEAERTRLRTADFVVAKTGDQGPAWTASASTVLAREMEDPSAERRPAFRRVAEYPLPDGSTGLLYEAISHTTDLTPASR